MNKWNDLWNESKPHTQWLVDVFWFWMPWTGTVPLRGTLAPEQFKFFEPLGIAALKSLGFRAGDAGILVLEGGELSETLEIFRETVAILGGPQNLDIFQKKILGKNGCALEHFDCVIFRSSKDAFHHSYPPAKPSTVLATYDLESNSHPSFCSSTIWWWFVLPASSTAGFLCFLSTNVQQRKKLCMHMLRKPSNDINTDTVQQKYRKASTVTPLLGGFHILPSFFPGVKIHTQTGAAKPPVRSAKGRISCAER